MLEASGYPSKSEAVILGFDLARLERGYVGRRRRWRWIPVAGRREAEQRNREDY
jgi:hypothetical protein